MIEKIDPFVVDKDETTMKYGYYYKAKFKVPFSKDERFIRVWIPGDYDFNDQTKRFPVIYFSDGQNLVNKYLTAFDEWYLDEVWHNLWQKDGISFIAVGIDSPSDVKQRANELNPPFVPNKHKWEGTPVGDKYVDFIADVLKPLIDKLFFTKSEKAYTAIAGSSMGGIMAFYGAVRRSDIFGFSLDFSPAFLLYTKKKWLCLLNEFNIIPNSSRFFFYVGGKGEEKLLVKNTFFTYDYLNKLNFDDKNLALIYDTRMPHHESAWCKYLADGISFWLNNK